MAVIGENNKANIFLDADINADVQAHIGGPLDMTRIRAVSLQLITEDRVSNQRQFDVTNTDNVVASTHTWTMANGGFLATDVGGRLIVSGTVSNDGTYTITSRTSATVVVTGGTQVNETFAATVRRSPIAFVIPPGTLDGAWLIEASNDYVGPKQASNFGDPTLGREHWTNVTTMFTIPGVPGGTASAAIAVVSHLTASTTNQLAQAAVLTCRKLRITFTATAGSGRALALISAGNYSEGT